MNFLAPWYVPLAAAAVAVPPLVLLYFLKLRRREIPVPSTLLWRRAVEDLQVNSPFQRLRNNLLLILQLLILLAAIMAIAEPMLAGSAGEGQVYVLLMDQSASMGAMEGDGETRLDIAKDEARRFVDNLRADDRAMIIGFAERATVLCMLTGDKGALHRAIDNVVQTHGRTMLREAMRLAEAPSSLAGEVSDAQNPIRSARYVLFTDGRISDAEDVRVQRGTLEIIRVGTATENVGIVGLDVRRHYERPELLSVLARVRNFGARPVSRDLALLVDGTLRATQTIELDPLGAADELMNLERSDLETRREAGNEATAAFDLVLESAAEIEVRMSGEDALAVDDRVIAVATPPRPLSILLVTSGNRYLRMALAAMPAERFDVWSPREYEDAPEDALVKDGRCIYDVVVLDGHATDRLPPGSYMFFAASPLTEDVDLGAVTEQDVFLDWDDTHPILRHVPVQEMARTVVGWHEMTLPQYATSLIEATNGPVLGLLHGERHQYLLCAFGIFDESRTMLNAPWVIMDSGFVIFMYNAVRFLGGSSTSGAHPSVRPGQSFTVAARPNVTSVTVTRPDGGREDIPVRGIGLASYSRTDHVGIYRVATGIPGEDARAVNLLDDHESFIAPQRQFRIAAEDVTVTESVDPLNRPLWPYVLGALGLILLLEWIIYNKRIFV